MRFVLIIAAFLCAAELCAYASIQQDVIERDTIGGGGGGDLSSSDIDTFSELDAMVTDEGLVNLNDAQTLLNKVIDGNSNTLKMLRDATDCTTFTGAVDGQYCWEQDDNVLYVCETADVCDTAGEWAAVASVAALADLTDVTLTSPQDGEYLKFVTDTWVNGALDVNASVVAFDDTDGNFTATNVGAAIEELDDVNGSGPNAADAKVDWSQLGNVPPFRETLYQLRAQAGEPPAASYATIWQRNSHPTLRFNGNVCTVWTFVMPSYYGGNGVTVTFWYVSSETTNDTDWDGYWERIDTGQDIDSDSFATAVSADNNANNATSGIATEVSITFTDGAQMDSCAADELCRFRLCRDDTSDTGGADTVDFLGGRIRETP